MGGGLDLWLEYRSIEMLSGFLKLKVGFSCAAGKGHTRSGEIRIPGGA